MFKGNELQKCITMILNQKVMTWMVKGSSCENRIKKALYARKWNMNPKGKIKKEKLQVFFHV